MERWTGSESSGSTHACAGPASAREELRGRTRQRWRAGRYVALEFGIRFPSGRSRSGRSPSDPLNRAIARNGNPLPGPRAAQRRKDFAGSRTNAQVLTRSPVQKPDRSCRRSPLLEDQRRFPSIGELTTIWAPRRPRNLLCVGELRRPPDLAGINVVDHQIPRDRVGAGEHSLFNRMATGVGSMPRSSLGSRSGRPEVLTCRSPRHVALAWA
jgi:hypothetical protein